MPKSSVVRVLLGGALLLLVMLAIFAPAAAPVPTLRRSGDAEPDRNLELYLACGGSGGGTGEGTGDDTVGDPGARAATAMDGSGATAWIANPLDKAPTLSESFPAA